MDAVFAEESQKNVPYLSTVSPELADLMDVSERTLMPWPLSPDDLTTDPYQPPFLFGESSLLTGANLAPKTSAPETCLTQFNLHPSPVSQDLSSGSNDVISPTPQLALSSMDKNGPYTFPKQTQTPTSAMTQFSDPSSTLERWTFVRCNPEVAAVGSDKAIRADALENLAALLRDREIWDNFPCKLMEYSHHSERTMS